LASSARAKTPAASGAAAEVPLGKTTNIIHEYFSAKKKYLLTFSRQIFFQIFFLKKLFERFPISVIFVIERLFIEQ